MNFEAEGFGGCGQVVPLGRQELGTEPFENPSTGKCGRFLKGRREICTTDDDKVIQCGAGCGKNLISFFLEEEVVKPSATLIKINSPVSELIRQFKDIFQLNYTVCRF